jgi:Transmembrane protein 231
LLFKSFTGLTVQEFDDIFDKEIAKKYDKYELQRLSSTKRKRVRERELGAGRPFKLDVKDRFLMLLVYYRLYIHENLVACWYSFISCLAIFKYIFHSNKIF